MKPDKDISNYRILLEKKPMIKISKNMGSKFGFVANTQFLSEQYLTVIADIFVFNIHPVCTYTLYSSISDRALEEKIFKYTYVNPPPPTHLHM